MSLQQLPHAVVMNMFYTGLGIARSLGERGISVVGLSSHKAEYGNHTRFARAIRAPDYRDDPLLFHQFLLALGRDLPGKSIIFPTRDEDTLFLDRYRDTLVEHFIPVIPNHDALDTCLDKWRTVRLASSLGIPCPQSWLIRSRDELESVLPRLPFPCVLKPVAAFEWRKNWRKAGGRKAIRIESCESLVEQYAAVSRLNGQVLIQESIEGDDASLFIAACFLGKSGKWVASFHTQKLLQAPDGFGTGCIVQNAYRPELDRPTCTLLEGMQFSGIAEVEYKWVATPRPARAARHACKPRRSGCTGY
jgi:D-aspartate ligase